MNFEIAEVERERAIRILMKNHYRKTIPVLNKVFLGGFLNGELRAVMTLGWGTRPKHTIKKLFEELDTKDYFEIGRMALDNSLPKNSETQFIGKCIHYIRANYLNIKVLFTWADGMLGKVGTIYQASNFYYTGFIWTDLYFDFNGEAIHPRTTNKIGGRTAMDSTKYNHYLGKQFRYVYFINRQSQKNLMQNCKVEISKEYPTKEDLEWKQHIGGKYVITDTPPIYNPNSKGFSDNAKKNAEILKQRELSDFSVVA